MTRQALKKLEKDVVRAAMKFCRDWKLTGASIRKGSTFAPLVRACARLAQRKPK